MTNKLGQQSGGKWNTFTTELTEQNAPLSTTVSINWDLNFLYMMVIVDRYAGIHILIDADNNGWFHGKDNYEIVVDPSYPTPTDTNIIGRAHIWDSSDELIAAKGIPMWDDDPAYPGGQLITKNDIVRYARAYGSGFLVQLAIPRNSTTGMNLEAGDKIGLLMTFDYLSRVGGTYARLFEKDAWVRPTLVTSRDTTPPISQMDALPQETEAKNFTVSWNGIDSGSGLEAFDVQYRDGASGQWTDWQMQTASNTNTFTGLASHTYYFRTRGWDKAGNVEVYPPGDGDTWTKLILAPVIDVDPQLLVAKQFPDSESTQTLTISNNGDSPLIWNIKEGDTSCDSPTNIPWLSVLPDKGTTASMNSTTTGVTFDSTMLAPGTYIANLCVASDDPVTDLVQIPVSLTVIPLNSTIFSPVIFQGGDANDG